MMPRDGMVETAPTMLALDFYDGVIEGIGRNVIGYDEAYFTMLAWDDRTCACSQSCRWSTER